MVVHGSGTQCDRLTILVNQISVFIKFYISIFCNKPMR